MEERKDWYKDVKLRSSEEMSEDLDWWKPEPGQYELEFISDAGKEYPVEFEGRTRNKVPFKIKVKDKEYMLGVTVATTDSSFYGQLVLLARKHDGLNGVKTNIIVQSTGKNRRYVIPEIIDYNQSELN